MGYPFAKRKDLSQKYSRLGFPWTRTTDSLYLLTISFDVLIISTSDVLLNVASSSYY
jgi:hypothetical protein